MDNLRNFHVAEKPVVTNHIFPHTAEAWVATQVRKIPSLTASRQVERAQSRHFVLLCPLRSYRSSSSGSELPVRASFLESLKSVQLLQFVSAYLRSISSFQHRSLESPVRKAASAIPAHIKPPIPRHQHEVFLAYTRILWSGGEKLLRRFGLGPRCTTMLPRKCYCVR